MDIKMVKLCDFQDAIRTDNWAALMSIKLDGFTFSEALQMAAIHTKAIRFHNALNRDMARLQERVANNGKGYENEVYEPLPVL